MLSLRGSSWTLLRQWGFSKTFTAFWKQVVPFESLYAGLSLKTGAVCNLSHLWKMFVVEVSDKIRTKEELKKQTQKYLGSLWSARRAFPAYT